MYPGLMTEEVRESAMALKYERMNVEGEPLGLDGTPETWAGGEIRVPLPQQFGTITAGNPNMELYEVDGRAGLET